MLVRLRLLNLFYTATRLKHRPKLVAANCSVHCEDFRSVNGFDERFVGWGYEDEDLARRLRRRGVRVVCGSRDCLALHLFHQVHESHRPSSRGTANYRYFHQNRYLTACRRGLEHRPLEALRYEVLGEPPPLLESLLEDLGAVSGKGARKEGSPEVRLIFPGTRQWPRPGGELSVSLSSELSAAGPLEVRRYLEEVL
jgi:hypothetical protein